MNNIFYYVPIEATLQLVLRSKDSQNLLTSQLTSNQEVLEDWVDGANGSELLQYSIQHFPQSKPIFIQIYFDEVETVNPLGSKLGCIKLGLFILFLRIYHHSLILLCITFTYWLWHTLKISRSKRSSLS